MDIKTEYRCSFHPKAGPLSVSVDLKTQFSQQIYIKVNPCKECRKQDIKKGHKQITDSILNSMDNEN
jgi:hypothetical protein